MRFTLNGEELRLRRLSNEEYDRAEDLAKAIGKPLTRCPTCRTRQDDDPENDEAPSYRYRGEEFECDCRTQIALYTRYLIAGIPEEYMRLDWAEYNGSEGARVFVAEYLDNWENLRLHGLGAEFGGPNLGIGKTFAATHIGKILAKQGQRVYFTPFVEMVAAFEKENGQELEHRIRMTPFVILDDIMEPKSQRQANFYHTRFEAIIRHRTNYNLPTIITTNLTTRELEMYYPRTYSLLSAKQMRIDMDGEDVRAEKGRDDFDLALNGEVRPIT